MPRPFRTPQRIYRAGTVRLHLAPPDLSLLIASPHAAIEERIASFSVSMNTVACSGCRRFS